MMIKFARFNTYLAAAIWLPLVCGCQSPQSKKEKEEKKQATIIELHLEVNRDGAGDNEAVPIYRENPILVNVSKSPFVGGASVVGASVVDDEGGFAIRLKFNWQGAVLLQEATTGNRDKRIAVFCNFGPSRWLASPVIRKGISDGIFTFTPDATREEAERIVRGLNNLAKKIKEDDKL